MPVFKREMRKTRHRTAIEAWVTLDGGFAKRGCVVLDISTSGARLQLQSKDKLDGKLALTMNKDVRKATRCKLVWQRGNQVGVEFVHAA